MSAYSLVDTHCHLDALRSWTPDEVVPMAYGLGVSLILCPSYEEANLLKVVQLASRFPPVFAAQGIHPHDAKTYDDRLEKIIKETVHKKRVAIGEIGLDYHYNLSTKEEQIKAFERQLQLACDLDLPVILHAREACEDMIDVLTPFLSSLKKRGVFHSFSSSKKLWEWALTQGFYMGYNGMITFKNAEELRELVKATPRDKILLETDAPYLAPTPHRGKENGPQYLPFIAQSLSNICDLPLAEISAQIYTNSFSCFSFCLY